MNQHQPPRRPDHPGQPVRKINQPSPRPSAPRPQTPPPSRPLIHPARAARRRRSRTVILAILVTVALLCCLLVGLIFSELFTAIGTLIDRNKGPDVEVTTTAPQSSGENENVGTPDPVGMAMTTVDKQKADIHVGNLLLVNADTPYVFPATTPSTLVNLFDNRPWVTTESGEKIRAYKVRNGQQVLDRLALEALNAMMEDFYAEYKVGDLLVTWSHRTLQEQQDLYDLYVADYPGYSNAQIKELLKTQVDTAGYSEHHIGTGIDIKVFTDSGITYTLDEQPGYFSWLKTNAYKYGFIHRYPADKASVTGVGYDPYHFRYVEAPHATYIYQNNLCFEEYLEQLRNTTSPEGKHLTVSVDGGETYEVYYVKATGNTTSVPVPAELPYAISGDNMNGFIVTVTVN